MTSASFIWNNITEYQQKDQTSVGSYTRNRNRCQPLWQPQEVRSWHCSTVRVCAVCVQQQTYSTAICLFVLLVLFSLNKCNHLHDKHTELQYQGIQGSILPPHLYWTSVNWRGTTGREVHSCKMPTVWPHYRACFFYCKVTLTQYILSIIFWIIKSRRLGKNLTGLHTHPSRL